MKLRPCIIEGDICKIPLNDGQFAICDAEDYELVSQHNWTVLSPNQTYPYVVTNVRDGWKDDGYAKLRTQYLHRLIMGRYYEIDEKNIDHKNHDTLNNCKSNLRAVSQAVNILNRRSLDLRNRTGYRGVSHAKKEGRYYCALNGKPKTIYLGTFDSPEAAAVVWDIAVMTKYPGDVLPHTLNFPDRFNDYKTFVRLHYAGKHSRKP